MKKRDEISLIRLNILFEKEIERVEEEKMLEGVE